MGFKGKEATWGAIFMSNKETKKECLRRSLFGLPDVQSHIVKRVKSGMMLFLFEYEQRLLHGVFEAASDGAINIEPRAFRSSGKSFAAQVRVRRIWLCDPLSEPEFSVAIKGNYFTDKMFNFLLSQDQVSSLLHMFSAKKRIDVQPYRKKGASSEMYKIRTDSDVEVRARHAQLEDDGVHSLNKMEYDPYFPNFEHHPELASATAGSEDRYVPDRSLQQYSGFSLDPSYANSSHRSAMELDAGWSSSLGYTYRPDATASRSDNFHFRRLPGLALTTNGVDDGYHPDKVIEFSHNTGTLLDPGFSYPNYPSSTELVGEGNTYLRFHSPSCRTACENEDYISLSACDNDDAVHSFEPFSGRRYFMSNTPAPAGIICDENRALKAENFSPYSRPGILCEDTREQISENHIPYTRPDILCEETREQISENHIPYPRPDILCEVTREQISENHVPYFRPSVFCEETREQKSENLIPYSPPSGIFGRESRNIESPKLEGFSYAEHDQRRSVFTRLSGLSGTLPNEEEKKSICSEGEDILTANDLIQRLLQKQRKGSFGSVFSRLSRGDRLIRTDVKVPTYNDIKRKWNAHGVDDKVDAENGGADSKRRKRMVRSLDNVKVMNHIKTRKSKVDEEVTQIGRDLGNRQSRTEEAMPPIVATEDNVKCMELDSVGMQRYDADGGTTEVGLTQATETIYPMIIAEDYVKSVMLEAVDEIQIPNKGEEAAQIGQGLNNWSPQIAQTSPTIAVEENDAGCEPASITEDLDSRPSLIEESEIITISTVAAEDTVEHMKADFVGIQGFIVDEEMTKVGPSHTQKTNMSSLFAIEEIVKPMKFVSVGTTVFNGGEEMTKVGLSQAKEAVSSMVATEDNVQPMKGGSGGSQRLNEDEEMAKVGLSRVAETSPTIASDDKDADIEPSSSTVREGKNAVENFMSLELELNQQT